MNDGEKASEFVYPDGTEYQESGLKSQQLATHLYSKNDQMRVLGHQGSFS